MSATMMAPDVGAPSGANQQHAADHDDPLFKSAHEALIFAHNFSNQQFAKTAMGKLMQSAGGTRHSGKGLGGLDGAAQAGMILARVVKLPKHEQQCIHARYGQAMAPCGDCGQDMPTQAWKEAVEGLTFWVVTSLTGITHLHLRRAMTAKYFGGKVDMKAMAIRCGVHQSTMSRQYSIVAKTLRSLENKVMAEIERELQESGMVGQTY